MKIANEHVIAEIEEGGRKMTMVMYEHGGQWGWVVKRTEIEQVLGERVVLEEVEEVKGEEEESIMCPDGVRRTPRKRWAMRGENGVLGYLVEV